MPKLKDDQVPKKCRDRNQCFSWHQGKRIYHGKWGTPEADTAYKRFKIAVLENPGLPFRVNGGVGGVLIAELADAFLDYFEKAQRDKSHVTHFRIVIGYLVEVYGELAVNEFSPKKLKVCRAQRRRIGLIFTRYYIVGQN